MKIFNAPMVRVSLLSLALLLLISPIGHSQISPDLTFSGDCKYFVSDGSSREEIYDMAIDGQGRIILAGFTNYDPDEGGKSRGLVIRLLPDGNPDTSFGGGKVYIDFPNSNDELYGVAIDNNNNIFVCGRTEIIDAAIFKILGSNGSLDPFFGTSGRSILSAAAMFNDIALTSNNQIVVVGWGIVGNDADFLVAKYNSNGSLDTSFGPSGYKTAGTYEDEFANSLAVQSDGKIVVSGYQVTCSTSDNCYDPVLSRFTSSGQLDSGFGLGGMFPIGAQYEAISFNVAIQNVQGEERILVSGYHEPGNDYYAGFLARYRPNGNPDDSFGGSSSGLVTINDLGSTRMTVMPDNKILLLSSSYYYQSPNSFYRIRLMRRNADGSLDISFGSNGIFDQQIGGFQDSPKVVKTASNKVYVAGSTLQTLNNYTDYDGFVTRFIDCAGGPNLLISAVNATCGQPNGSVTVTPSGNSPFSYLWNNGQTTATINNLSANTYFVTVTDANGCSSTATKAVQVVPLATINLAKTDAKCGQNNGSINTTVASGAVTSYVWSNGATTANITNLAPGTYTLTATDVNGCTIVKSSTVNNAPPSVFTYNQINPTCDGSNGSISVVLQSGAAITGYVWSNGATSNPVNNLPAGQYSVTLTDANGCIYTSSNIVLSSTSVATLNVSTSNTTCGLSNGSASVTAQGGSTIQSYLWSNGATNPTILNLPAGTYSVTATDVNGCIITDQGTIEPSSTFNISLGPDLTIQPSQSATLNAQVPGAVSYQWSTGATTPAIIINAAGTYAVTVTNAEGCTAVDAIAVSLVSSSVEPQWAKWLTLLPNPTHDVAFVRIKIDRSIDIDLKLMDMAGQVLWHSYQHVPSGAGDIEISICRTLPPGQYLVYISDSEGAAIRKLVVL